ncbi:transcriptional regulator [Actinomyces israelii]|uniref:transcriptional regulator n=1 Tax=Actinomyces israelii TaxID=1659 RepID=UPI003C6C64DE
MRFAELREAVGTSDSALSKQLTALEREGYVRRRCRYGPARPAPGLLGIEPALHRLGHERVVGLGEAVQAAPPALEHDQEGQRHEGEGDDLPTGQAARRRARAPGDADDNRPLGPQDLQVVASAPRAPCDHPRQGGGARGARRQRWGLRGVVQRGGGEEGHEQRRGQVCRHDEPPPGAAPPGPGAIRPVRD